MGEADDFDLGFPINFSSTIFETHPSEERFFNCVVGAEEDGSRGLLHWMSNLIEDQLPSDWDGVIAIGTFPIKEVMRKGIFPFIQIHPVPSDFENLATCMDEHTITIQIITTIKNPDVSWAYFEAVRYSSDLYDLFKANVPQDDYDAFERTPQDGRTDFDFREGQNQWIAYSMVELNYQFQISTEEKQ